MKPWSPHNLGKRQLANTLVLTLSTISAIGGIAVLFWILGVLFYNGLEAMGPALFLNDGAPPGYPESGLRHAILGQLLLTLGATALGVPMGVLAGTWLSEYGRNSHLSRLIRDVSDIMMSTPSIVVGTFVYAVMVAKMGHFSGWSGMVALGLMMIPIVLRTTDDMLALVPIELREAAAALGAPKYKVIIQVVYRGARVGIFTGILLAVARIAGETAPLLFTAFNNNFFSLNMNEPIASLTVTMFNYATSPYEDWQRLGWAAAFLLAMFVLSVNILGRLILRKKKERK